MKGVPYMDKAHPLMVLKGDNCIVCVIHAAADPTVGLAEPEGGLENPTNSGPRQRSSSPFYGPVRLSEKKRSQNTVVVGCVREKYCSGWLMNSIM